MWGSIGGLVGVELSFDSFRKICHLLELKLFSLVLFLIFPCSEGPKYEDYSFTLVPANKSRTNADLGAVAGPHKAQVKFKGNSLVTLELSLGLAGTPVAPKDGVRRVRWRVYLRARGESIRIE